MLITIANYLKHPPAQTSRWVSLYQVTYKQFIRNT